MDRRAASAQDWAMHLLIAAGATIFLLNACLAAIAIALVATGLTF
jgi:hypothetical protein